MTRDVVVGIGGGGSGWQAARTAARLADLTNSSLVLVFGYEAVAMGPRGGALEHEVAAIGEEITDEIRRELAEAYPSLTIERELVQSRPVDALIDVAAARGAELIAVGHGGRGPLKAALLGSITYEIVHRSPIPVLVVPNDEADDA